MNAVALKSHSFVARLGAILAAFVLAFSLVSLTAPAHADEAQTMKVWTEFKFAGDTVTISMKEHSTVQGADHKTMCNRYSSGGTSPLGFGTVNKSEITQYEGVEVCAVEVTAPLETVISSTSSDSGVSGIGFNVERDGSNVRVEGDLTGLSSLTSYGDSSINYRLTFAGGIVSAEGAEVSGNTAKLKPGEKYKVVGNPGSGSSNNGGSFPSASSDATSLAATTSPGIPAATSSPSVTASDAIKPQETTSNAAAAGAGATSSAVTTSAVGSTGGSNDTIIYGAVVVVGALALGGLGWSLLQSRKKP